MTEEHDDELVELPEEETPLPDSDPVEHPGPEDAPVTE